MESYCFKNSCEKAKICCHSSRYLMPMYCNVCTGHQSFEPTVLLVVFQCIVLSSSSACVKLKVYFKFQCVHLRCQFSSKKWDFFCEKQNLTSFTFQSFKVVLKTLMIVQSTVFIDLNFLTTFFTQTENTWTVSLNIQGSLIKPFLISALANFTFLSIDLNDNFKWVIF